jgi:hypothetical protein
MSVTLTWYAKARANVYAAKINFLADDIRCALLGPGYTPDRNVDEKWSDISAFEIAGTGYVAGGELLANKTVTYDAGLKRTSLDADDVLWPASSLAGRVVAIYDATHVDQPLMGFADYGATGFACTNGTLKVKFSDNGVLTDTLNP